MNYKLFQICFTEDQLKDVDPLFTPFDNIANEHPELREYHNFIKAVDNNIVEGLDAWGFFGPRWKKKLRYGSPDITYEIENNPGHDVYLFNHARISDALFFNVWEQGESWHPGIRKIARTVLEQIDGCDSGVINDLMIDQTTCYCSYFVATKEFWNDYLEFLSKVSYHLENLPEEEKKIYEQSAKYKRDESLNLFPFIIERMFSTFLLLNRKKYKIHSKQYDYSVYEAQIGEFAKVLAALNNLKTLTLKHDSEEIFKQWNTIRVFILKAQPKLVSFD
jgi:hypothetical protein